MGKKKGSTKNVKPPVQHQGGNADITLTDISPSKVTRACLDKSRKSISNSEAKFKRARVEYYKNHGGIVLVPKSKRLNWEVVNQIEAALNTTKGKRREFSNDSGKMANEIDHLQDIQSQIPKVSVKNFSLFNLSFLIIFFNR